jgi:hypothetical protein
MGDCSEVIATVPPEIEAASGKTSETVGDGTAEMFSDRLVDNEEPVESWSRAVKEKAPAANGIPERVPSEDLSVRPGGICPAVASQE